jgi:hypothetical protein
MNKATREFMITQFPCYVVMASAIALLVFLGYVAFTMI